MKLRRFKRIQKMKGNLVGVGWYQENQWALLLEHAEDKEELEPTYIEWLENAYETTNKFEASGVHYQKILIDVEDMIKWCKENEVPLNGESRSNYIAKKTRENDSRT